MQADGKEGHAACDALGVDVLPTVQFWREGHKLWEHRGIVELDQNLGEGERVITGVTSRVTWCRRMDLVWKPRNAGVAADCMVWYEHGASRRTVSCAVGSSCCNKCVFKCYIHVLKSKLN